VKKAKKVKRQPYYCEVRGSWVIPLTQGRETLVDAEDVEFLCQFNWTWQRHRVRNGYARDRNSIRLHRLIMNAPSGMDVDHINGNSLDNRKSNLRICSHRENMQNTHKHRSGKLIGGYFSRRHKKWHSKIRVNGKAISLGYHSTEIEANYAYMKAYNDLITKEKSAA
jgi:hypothetical protein